LETLSREFGSNIAFLVDGVTKLGKLRYQGIKRHVESLRKMFVAMAEDIRVILIRLADRLHNIRTLQHVRPDKQVRIAMETLEVYAPIANRLGMWRMKGLLEDGSFPYAYPEEYKKVLALRKTKGKENLKHLEKVYRTLSQALAERGFPGVEIDYRIKYLYSLYAKLKRKGMDINKIYDLMALRIVTDTVENCYAILGIIHSIFRPVPGEMADYIANPKTNGYQSIHTTIFTGDGSMAEVQIRTTEMQREAEYGIASHIIYDEAGKPKEGGKLSRSMKWIQELITWQKHVKESEEFLHVLKTDFFQDRIFVFTPKGDVIELPAGATALDMAYMIHSDIGNKASAAYINDKFVSLDTTLKNGDTVKIETKKTGKPSAKWLELVKTVNAKKHIRTAIESKKKS
jgi:GTP pyrophosphokinase